MRISEYRLLKDVHPYKWPYWFKYSFVGLALFAFILSTAYAQNTTKVTGQVKNESGQPVPQASVTVKGRSGGVSADENGNFVITVSPTATLVVSSVGYNSIEVPVNNRASVLVTLTTATSSTTNEVIVIGYGSQRKKDVTGSVASIAGDKVTEIPAPNVARALQGRVAGVVMSQTSTKPGSDMQIRIRGTRSLNASNDPLIVLDGIPFSGSISDIDPNSIKSVDILKDASATAIYGSRGANGVVLITTNKGSQGQKARLSYNGFYGAKTVFGKYPMMSGPEFVALRKAAAANGMVFNNTLDEKDSVNTDWQDLLYRTGWVTNHGLDISGGSEKGNYSVGLGYYKEQGVIPTQYFERYSLRTSLEQRIGNALRIGITTNTNYSNNHNTNLSPGNAVGLSPILSPYNADGSWKSIVTQNTSGAQWVYTRHSLEALGNKYIDLTRALSSYNSLYGEVKIPGVEGLKYRANIGLNFRQSNYGTYTGQGVFSGVATTVSNATISNSESLNWTIENLLTYDRVFKGKHKINAVGLYSAQQTTAWGSSSYARDIPSDAFQFYNLGRANIAATTDPNNQSYTQSGLMSWMGRAIYSFDDRYMFSATFRTDASSVLAPGHKWHAYPAVSAGWNISNESFMKNKSLFDMLKLRVGYGQTSNQAINPYQTLGLLTTVPYNFGADNNTGMYVTQLPNPKLGWEFSKTWNYGVDFSMFKNRLSGTLEYYVQNTDNVLLKVGLPPTSGVDNYTANIGATQNKGIELTLNGVILDNLNGWTWEAGVNIYGNRNKLVRLASGLTKDPGNLWFVGSPIDVIYDYQKVGLWQTADSAQQHMNILEPGGKVGMVKVQYTGGYNPDGTPVRAIGPDDRQVQKIQSNFEGGFNTRVAYKGFELSVIGAFKNGGILTSALYGSSGYLNNLNSRSGNNVKVDYWTPTHTNAKYPRPGGVGGDNPKYGSTLAYFDASYMKIRTITLGYSFGQKWMKTAGIQKMRVYCTLENPFVLFSPYKKESGMDPEPNSYGDQNVAVAGVSRILIVGTNTPSTRSYLIGLNVTF
ncbi:TonB-linked outer membrane protein, SusC/RagA family [Filimonas lacunae]|uniref:TonB-linked outer membrane protein, SusC/RagA family n=1 Tax=Filimonas lacunae TaxID=477680 RepID=A0A173MGV7_9BACT|nr:TonB-dependent receptor [Filimonas lacunae]BAV06825.1 outer membrane protein SusC, starch binding [Filimonas lacunae]SIS99206.1 TonB-linked outer membrane protein, SusC/RagA family [Filimonas lacunae]